VIVRPAAAPPVEGSCLLVVEGDRGLLGIGAWVFVIEGDCVPPWDGACVRVIESDRSL